jgi:hypothetical protein
VFRATNRGRNAADCSAACVLTSCPLRLTLREVMPQHKAQNDGVMRLLNFRVEAAMIDRFREVAEADHRTVSQELRRLMEQRIAEADETEETAA